MKIRNALMYGAVAVLTAVLLLALTPMGRVFGQSASYAFLQYVYGANVNGKPTFVISSQVVDTQTTVAAGTLNGTNSPFYDVSVEKEAGRMVNISFNVTAVPGTSPSLTPTVQQSDDGGQTWYNVNAQDGTTFAAITSTGAVTGKDFPLYGELLRVHYAASGTGNFTFTDTAKQAQ